IVKPAGEDHAGNEVVYADSQIENSIRLQREAVHIMEPGWVEAAHNSSSHQRIDITIGKHHKSGAQRRDNLVFESIRKIRSVKKAQGNASQGMYLFGLLNSPSRQLGTLDAGIQHSVSLLLEPGSEQLDLSGTAHAVRALNYNQSPREFRQIHFGQNHRISFSHGATLNLLAWVSLAFTIWRIWTCCSSMGSVASTVVRSNSGIMFSYSSRFFP